VNSAVILASAEEKVEPPGIKITTKYNILAQISLVTLGTINCQGAYFLDELD